MKRLLLAGTAIAGVALMTTPAHADLKLDLGGYFRGYAVYTDNDETAPSSLRTFNFLRDNEVHFTGETTTDQGLTVGVHNEIKLGSNAIDASNPRDFFDQPGEDPTMTDEAYIYFSGGWGRVNLGSEDGAAYLLQVAAPSADSNIDGLRVYIQGFNNDIWDDGLANGSFRNGYGHLTNTPLGYDNADFRQSERLTYLTPKWNGFQAGVSYAPQPGMQDPFGGTFGFQSDNNSGAFDNLWELAARWDGEFQGLGVSVGGGYAAASAQNKTGSGAGNIGSDDLQTWDVGLNLAWQGWSLGGAYKHSNTGTSGPNTDDRVWVVGGAWDNGPWHVGLSYYDNKADGNAYGVGGGATNDLDLQRYAFGGGYTYGPGMTFRGSVAWLNVDNHATSVNDPNQLQVAVGTDVNF